MTDELIERAALAASTAWENADDGPDEWLSVVRAVLAEMKPATVPAPITAEDVRAAERAWGEFLFNQAPSAWGSGGKDAFIAEHLNRARDHAPDPGPGRDETTEGNGT